jgi:hypothetical protein
MANMANLAPAFAKQLDQYRGTKLWEQEVLGELVDLEDGKVVSRSMFKLWPQGKAFPKFEYILQSYDCAFTEKTYNDPTAALCFGVFKPDDGPMSVMVVDAWHDHLTSHVFAHNTHTTWMPWAFKPNYWHWLQAGWVSV